MLKALALTLAALVASPAAAQGISIPVHGNWCGPGHGGQPSPYGGRPVDLLDAACMRHDYCVVQRGRFDCGCDIAFMDELRMSPWPNPGMASKARAVFEAIAMVPCEGPGGQAAKIERAASAWMAGVLTGRESPWEVLDRLGALAAEGMSRAY